MKDNDIGLFMLCVAVFAIGLCIGSIGSIEIREGQICEALREQDSPVTLSFCQSTFNLVERKP